jgi:metal-responsive CopG/Arc/MetJ family transcriptional regulator
MRIKTSVSLDEHTLAALDRAAEDTSSRSRLIEQAILEFLERRRRAVRDARDLALLNREASSLNREMAEILSYQVKL